jgi:hypothetical protein
MTQFVKLSPELRLICDSDYQNQPGQAKVAISTPQMLNRSTLAVRHDYTKEREQNSKYLERSAAAPGGLLFPPLHSCNHALASARVEDVRENLRTTSRTFITLERLCARLPESREGLVTYVPALIFDASPPGWCAPLRLRSGSRAESGPDALSFQNVFDGIYKLQSLCVSSTSG